MSIYYFDADPVICAESLTDVDLRAAYLTASNLALAICFDRDGPIPMTSQGHPYTVDVVTFDRWRRWAGLSTVTYDWLLDYADACGNERVFRLDMLHFWETALTHLRTNKCKFLDKPENVKLEMPPVDVDNKYKVDNGSKLSITDTYKNFYATERCIGENYTLRKPPEWALVA